MINNKRRTILKTSLLAAVIPFPNLMHQASMAYPLSNNHVPDHYPYIDPEIVSSVVGKSHSDLDGVRKLVDARPELARSSWEWRYGDVESAIGAASHVGRRDIARYLISKGARPDIFTFAMLGNYSVVKEIMLFYPGIESTFGPHGISLLDHAYAGRRMKATMTKEEISNQDKLIEFLEMTEGASGPDYEKLSDEEKQKYLGVYKYGDKEDQGFEITLNMLNNLAIGPINGFGGGIYKVGEQTFIYNGAPSVRIIFELKDDIVYSLTVQEPDLTVKAMKIS